MEAWTCLEQTKAVAEVATIKSSTNKGWRVPIALLRVQSNRLVAVSIWHAFNLEAVNRPRSFKTTFRNFDYLCSLIFSEVGVVCFFSFSN